MKKGMRAVYVSFVGLRMRGVRPWWRCERERERERMILPVILLRQEIRFKRK